jgi:hypothetical protein
MTKFLKPVLEWYEEFSEPIRSRAIKNYNFYNSIHKKEYVASKRIAINYFDWERTTEGWEYWRNIYDQLEK